MRIEQGTGYHPYVIEAMVDADRFDDQASTLRAIVETFVTTIYLPCG